MVKWSNDSIYIIRWLQSNSQLVNETTTNKRCTIPKIRSHAIAKEKSRNNKEQG